jgi:hypothetical protein
MGILRKPMIQFTCEVCNKRKEKTKELQRFCSSKCRKQYWDDIHLNITEEEADKLFNLTVQVRNIISEARARKANKKARKA